MSSAYLSCAICSRVISCLEDEDALALLLLVLFELPMEVFKHNANRTSILQTKQFRFRKLNMCEICVTGMVMSTLFTSREATACRGRVVNIPSSYSEGPGFKSRP
jgi:hypothetical protein